MDDGWKWLTTTKVCFDLYIYIFHMTNRKNRNNI